MALNIESELLEQVKNGDEASFEQLYKQAYQHVYFLAYRICRSDDDAKEVAQLTFLQIHKSIVNLRDNKTFPSWLRQVVLSKCYNLFERNREAVLDPNDSVHFKNVSEQRRYMIPSAQARFKSDQEILMHLIDELPEKFRTVLVLAHFEGLSMLEMKELLNVPEGTVKSRLNTARKLLKEKVASYEQEEHIHLDFHNLDPVFLSSMYALSFSTLQVSIPALKGIVALPFLAKLRHISKVAGAKVAIASTITITAGVGAVGAYQAYTSRQAKESLPLPQHLYQENEIPFQSVQMKGNTYDQAKSAYFALTRWAHCELELQEKQPEEIQDYLVLYNALKLSNGNYYASLKQQGWDVYFERLAEK